MGLAYLNTPVSEVALAVRYAGVPVVAGVNYHAGIFGYDVFTGNEFHSVVPHTPVVVGYDVAELDKRVPPVGGIKDKPQEIGEPFLLQQFGCFGIFFAVFSDKPEVFGGDLTFSLCNTAGEMSVEGTIGINIVQAQTVGVEIIEGHLVSAAPVLNIFFCQGVGLLEQLRGNFQTTAGTGTTCEAEDFGTCGTVKPVAYACNNIAHWEKF